MPQLPKSEFLQALTALASERGISTDVVLEQLKAAMAAAYRREAREQGIELGEEELTAEVNSETGEAQIFRVTEKGKKEDVTPPGFSRIAAQTFRQIFRQKTREAEKEAVLSAFEERVGQLVSGVILRFDGQAARVDLGKAEAILPPEERIPGERLALSQRLTFLLKEIKEGPRGRDLVVSRSADEFVRRLFAREVPEIASSSVEIRLIARLPGVRTKIAVASRTSGVDPVGSCVGQKGVRVQAVINELGGEKIDVIPWTDDSTQLITAALSPAKNVSVTIVDLKMKRAKVRVPQDQLPLAIGKEGQNVQLASRLADFSIDVEGLEEAQPTKPQEKEETKADKKVTKSQVQEEHEAQKAA